jgi:hypothetical protein
MVLAAWRTRGTFLSSHRGTTCGRLINVSHLGPASEPLKLAVFQTDSRSGENADNFTNVFIAAQRNQANGRADQAPLHQPPRIGEPRVAVNTVIVGADGSQLILPVAPGS